MKRVVVGVEPTPEYDRHRRLLDALEALFPVTFASQSESRPRSGIDALLLLDSSRENALAGAKGGTPCFAICASGAAPGLDDAAPVTFHAGEPLDACLRGQTLADLERCPVAVVQGEANETPMASKGGRTFWVHRPGQEGMAAVDLVGVALPTLEPKSYLAEYFYRERFLRLLPLVHWLKQITRPYRWHAAPRRACLVFDDPTLPSPSYGCLQFEQLAAHARQWNYHAAIATIPLSGQRVSAENAALFRQQSSHLSLVIHGNDHTWHEMARVYPEPEKLAILAQAWQRITAMEQHSQLSVGRIMEAPYGVIDRGMIEPLIRLGYEATLITPLQFLRYNQAGDFPTAIGLGQVESLAGGLCFLPRIKMTAHWKTEALLAALLEQPIIIVGHHYDAIRNMERMREIATTLNALGDIQWLSLPEIARSQYQIHRDAARSSIRLGSRHVALPGQDWGDEIIVERPWLSEEADEPLLVRTANESAPEQRFSGGTKVRIKVTEVGAIELLSPPRQPINPTAVPVRRTHCWPLVRRMLMETRDRMYPYLRRSASPAGAN